MMRYGRILALMMIAVPFHGGLVMKTSVMVSRVSLRLITALKNSNDYNVNDVHYKSGQRRNGIACSLLFNRLVWHKLS